MKIARVQDPTGHIGYGIVQTDSVELIQGDVFGSWHPSGTTWRLQEVRLLSPLETPSLLCLGKNFRAFPGETNSKFPKQPLLFIKSTTSVIGPGDAIVLPAMAPAEVYYEAELAVVIGRRARNIATEAVGDYILGYTVANDVGARDCQAADGQWARAKSFDTFCPLGPWIETELSPGRCAVRSRLNGELTQESNTSLQIFSVPETVSFLSRCMTLLPGSVICMGSPATLQEPRPLLKPGDRVEVEVEGIGTLSNPVAGD